MGIINNISSYVTNKMKDTKGNIITEEEFVKDIGHNVVGDMKEQWKNKLEKLGSENYWDFDTPDGGKEKLFSFIENLLTEQRKELINQILSEAPDDIKVYDNWLTTHDRDDERYTKLTKGEIMYNKLNAQWREIINKLK